MKFKLGDAVKIKSDPNLNERIGVVIEVKINVKFPTKYRVSIVGHNLLWFFESELESEK